MAQAITVNQNKGSRGVGVLVVRSDASGFVTANSSGVVGVSRGATTSETISNMYIAEIVWSCNTAASNWTIARGGNTVFKCHGQNGYIDFQANQMRLETGGDSQANVVFTLVGAGNIIIKMHKQAGE